MIPKKSVKARQFKLPLDEGLLNSVLNNDSIFILDEKIFQDRNSGDVIVYLKYEDYSQNQQTTQPPPLTNELDF